MAGLSPPRSPGRRGVGIAVKPTDRTEVERRLAEFDRRLRRAADVIGPSGLGRTTAVAQTGTTNQRDIADLQTEALLERVGRLTAELDTMAPGDAGDLLVMRSLLADVSLVTAAFRWRVAAVERHLSSSAAHLEEARSAVVASREWDGTPAS